MHPDKSKFIPTQCITYLRFILNPAQMTITSTLEKKQKNLKLCQEILREDVVTTKTYREFSGSFSCFNIGSILL